MPKIAVYFANGIGNYLMMTPAIRALSDHYQSKIDMVFPSDNSDLRLNVVRQLCDSWDVVNKIIEYPAKRFDPNKYEILFTTAHCEKSQAGDIFKQVGIQFQQPEWIKTGIHEIEYYMQEVYKLGYKGTIPNIHIDLADKPLIKKRVGRRLIAFYNGAALLSQRWRWERKKWGGWKQLAAQLENYYNTDIIYLGGESEKPEGETLAKKNKNIKNYAGKLSFQESAKALSQCDLLISSDSAIMHVAEAIDVPVVALFGSTLVSKNRPYIGNYRIVRNNGCAFMPCQYHFRFTTCQEFKCMNNMAVGDVMKAVREII